MIINPAFCNDYKCRIDLTKAQIILINNLYTCIERINIITNRFFNHSVFQTNPMEGKG